MPAVAGVALAGVASGLKKSDTRDLLVAELAPGTTIAGALTRSRCPSAPVDWCRRVLPGGRARAVIANSGNANTFTGAAGDMAVRRTVEAAAGVFRCAETEVFVASTGVIGVPLPSERITDALAEIVGSLSPGAWEDAATAIMTTDTFPKGTTRTARIGGLPVTLNGIAKGSGMIAPDMATMLAFVFTDAAVTAPALRRLVGRAVDRSFNCITVDGDTSTSDTVLVAATGQAGNEPVEDPRHPRVRDFARKLEDLMVDLAQQVVRDGEGAEKFITIRVSGAASARAARRIGLAIANSPLVKTAVAGEDANWGRIIMAVGKAGERADPDRLAVAIGGIRITNDGELVPGYDETPVARHLRGRDILIEVNVGVGRGRATVWTCDLTHRYIDINASYRT